MSSKLTQRPAAVVKDLTISPNVAEEPEAFTLPAFQVKDLLDAIPKHCFERSALKSSAYVLMDFAMIAALATAAFHISTVFGSNGSLLSGLAGQAAQGAAWLLYWWFQGLVCTGVWVIAHECGHQAYSTSKTINNAVGWVLHSALLVPYHSWRISHARHHAATGHMTRDEVFVPRTASQVGIKTDDINSPSALEQMADLFEDAPLYNFVMVIAQQVLGWPLYLIRNASGQKHYPAHTNHFDPEAVIFDARHYWQIIASDIGLLITLTVLSLSARATSWTTVAMYYGVPYLLVNHWLVLITFLQHTDPNLPHYREGSWTFPRGALATQDRNVYNFFTHRIADTHVLHHVCSRIPHYHAGEATEALKTVLGDYYMFSNDHWLTSLFRVHRECRFVDDEGEVVFFKNGKGQTKRKAVVAGEDSGFESI